MLTNHNFPPSPRVYIIVESWSAGDLAERVNHFIEAGYEPHGSLVYNHCHDHATDEEFQHYYVQPMMLKEDTK
jgi:hypothetical protein